MTDAYCNMSVPPRTTVRQVVRPIGRYVEFNICRADFAQPFKSPQDWLDDFLVRHGDALDAVPRPSGYMISVSHNSFLYRDDLRSCRDPILTVAILGRVSGTLYVPHRRISFGKWLEMSPGEDREDSMIGISYVFPERYFPQFQVENQP